MIDKPYPIAYLSFENYSAFTWSLTIQQGSVTSTDLDVVFAIPALFPL